MASEEEPELRKQSTETLVSIQLEGYEVIEKDVKQSGNSGRVYLPNDWVGCRVKIIRLDQLVEK
ncbi:MAG: DUF2080 family transposase-associated protein [Candidatus Kariarchaeaceae archaeon]|jgi:putative transposon-encoded protein